MFSHSKISCYKQCPKMYEYKYINGLHTLTDGPNLIMGKLYHKGIELKSSEALNEYIDNENISFTEDNETKIVLTLAMVDAYFNRFGYNEIVRNELRFEFVLGGHVVQGYIDQIEEVEEGYYLIELKTAANIDKDYIDKLEINDQISRYYYAIENNAVENFILDKPLLGVKYRIIKKPQLRQKQKESLTQFRRRLVDRLSEPDNIVEIILTRTPEQINECIADTLEDMNAISRATRFTKTLSACSTYGRCPYMELCLGIPDAHQLYRKQEDREETTNE